MSIRTRPAAPSPSRLHPLPGLRVLGTHQVEVMDEAAGTLVACISGCVWLTLHEDSRDIVLKAGDSFRIDRPGPVVITAGKGAELHLVAHCPEPAASGAVGGWWRRLLARGTHRGAPRVRAALADLQP